MVSWLLILCGFSSIKCSLHGAGAVLSAQEQQPTATASSPRHHSQQSKLPSGIRSAASGAVKRQQLVSPLISVGADPSLGKMTLCYLVWVTVPGAHGHNFLLVLSLCLPPDSFRQQGLIDPASLLPEAALFLLSLLPLLLINTLSHTPLFGTEHLPALIY